MCDHKWIALTFEAMHPVSINTATIFYSQVLGYRVTEVICVECLEKKVIAESPAVEATRMIRDYGSKPQL